MAILTGHDIPVIDDVINTNRPPAREGMRSRKPKEKPSMESLKSLLGKFEELEKGSLQTSKNPWALFRYTVLSPEELSCSCDPNMTLIWIQWEFYYSHLTALGIDVLGGLETAPATERLKSIDEVCPTDGYTTKNLCQQCQRRNYDTKAFQINYCPRYSHSRNRLDQYSLVLII